MNLKIFWDFSQVLSRTISRNSSKHVFQIVQRCHRIFSLNFPWEFLSWIFAEIPTKILFEIAPADADRNISCDSRRNCFKYSLGEIIHGFFQIFTKYIGNFLENPQRIFTNFWRFVRRNLLNNTWWYLWGLHEEIHEHFLDRLQDENSWSLLEKISG